MLQNSLTIFYNQLDTAKPNIIRGAMNADFEEVKAALKENPACITEADEKNSLTALHIAAGECNYAMVDLLCSQPGYDVTLQDAWGRQPYFLAIAMGRDDIVNRMFRDIEEQNQQMGVCDDEPAEASNVALFRPKAPFGPV